jgi:hypothetical protein
VRPKADSPAPSANDGRLSPADAQADDAFDAGRELPSAVPDLRQTSTPVERVDVRVECGAERAAPALTRAQECAAAPPARAPLQTTPLTPDPPASAAAPSPEPPAEVAHAAPSPEVKSEPPPPTMPAAQQRQSRPEPDDLLSAIDLPKESLPKEPLTAEERAQVVAAEPPAHTPSPATARAPSVPPPAPRAPSRPPPRPASSPPPAPASRVAPPMPPPRPPSVLPPPPVVTSPPPAATRRPRRRRAPARFPRTTIGRRALARRGRGVLLYLARFKSCSVMGLPSSSSASKKR